MHLPNTRRTRTIITTVITWLSVMVLVASALGQRSGGSVGRSNWGSSPSSSSSSSSRSTSYTSTGGTTPTRNTTLSRDVNTSPSSGGGGGRMATWSVIRLVLAGLAVAGLLWVKRRWYTGVTRSPSELGAGDQVVALWKNGWWDASVLSARGQAWEIQYDGWSSEYNETVDASRIRARGPNAWKIWPGQLLLVITVLLSSWGVVSSCAPETGRLISTRSTATTYTQGQSVDIEWKGSWYPGEIRAVQGPDQYLVHYAQYDDSWDEVVPASRLTPAKGVAMLPTYALVGLLALQLLLSVVPSLVANRFRSGGRDRGQRVQLVRTTLAFAPGDERTAMLEAIASHAKGIPVHAELLSLLAEWRPLLKGWLTDVVAWEHSVDGVQGKAKARERFEAKAKSERELYQTEVVRNDDGGVRTQTYVPRDRKTNVRDPGIVVVTLLRATTTDFSGKPPSNPREALETATQADAGTLAAEFIWIPGDPADVMTADRLDVLYPGLARTEQGDRLRESRCVYCGFMCSGTIEKCPNCGGPRQK